MTDKPVDTHPQNTVADAATSLKQTVEAKTNSSVSDVFQIGGSVNNSTVINNPIINIHPLGNNHASDQQPSKSNQNKKLDNLPEKNDFFTGRVNELNQLAESIKSKKKVAISGLGGIGKTQTAIEFCYRQIANNSYQTILWVNAEKEANFNNSYWEVAYLLELVELGNPKSLKDNDIIFLVKRWLANNPNWLMVLDNLEDPKLIKDYLPSNHQDHILITTRSSPIDHAAIVPLNKMSLDTATLFLLKRAYPDKVDVNVQSLQELNIDSSLLADAQKLANAIDGLPLALKQAAAFIYETKCSLLDYLAFYQKALADKTAKNLDDHDSVFITFNLAFDKVRKESVTAAKLLEVCSFLDSDLIPEEIFTSAGKFLGDELAKLQDNTYEFNNCLKLLLGYSLIERDTNNKSLSIHRLVQAVIRDLLTEDNKKLLVDSLAKALWSFSSDDPENPGNWPIYQKLLPSVTSFFEFAKFYQSNVVEVAYLFHLFGIYSYTQAFYTQSLDFYNLAFDIKKLHFDDNHPSIAWTLDNIGQVYYQQGQYNKALEHFNLALSAKFLSSDKNHISIARTYNNIAAVYKIIPQYEKALNYYSQALNVYKIHSKNPSSTAMVLNNIGNIYECLNQYKKALNYYNQALSIYQHNSMNNCRPIALVLNNIGSVYSSLNKFSKAFNYYRKSLTIRKKIFPNGHPDIALTLVYIANLYETSNKQLEALNYYKDALIIFDQFFHPFHPYIIKLLNQYSQLLLKLNKTDEAQPLLDRLASLEQSKQE